MSSARPAELGDPAADRRRDAEPSLALAPPRAAPAGCPGPRRGPRPRPRPAVASSSTHAGASGPTWRHDVVEAGRHHRHDLVGRRAPGGRRRTASRRRRRAGARAPTAAPTRSTTPGVGVDRVLLRGSATRSALLLLAREPAELGAVRAELGRLDAGPGRAPAARRRARPAPAGCARRPPRPRARPRPCAPPSRSSESTIRPTIGPPISEQEEVPVDGLGEVVAGQQVRRRTAAPRPTRPPYSRQWIAQANIAPITQKPGTVEW